MLEKLKIHPWLSQRISQISPRGKISCKGMVRDHSCEPGPFQLPGERFFRQITGFPQSWVIFISHTPACHPHSSSAWLWPQHLIHPKPWFSPRG